jgi:putative transposase
MAMLEDVPDLTLDFLNEATQAWVEFEYNRKVHAETGEAPLVRFLAGPSVLRPSPNSAALRLAFTKTERRTQRKSDGTIVIVGCRFEIPNRYRHFTQVEVRYASWDLTQVHLVDDRTGQVLCRLFPQDKAANASGLRRALEPIAPELTVPPAKGIPPLLAKLLTQQAETGLPPAYLPKLDDDNADDGDDG